MDFTPGPTNPTNAAFERLQTQISLATNAVIQALVENRGYTLDSFLPDHAADLVSELVEMDGLALGKIVDADDQVSAANAQLDRLPKNALFPADPLKCVPRFVMREFIRDRASADSSVDYRGPTEMRREARKIADLLKIDLWAIADKARAIAEHEAAVKVETARIAEEARVERVKAKSKISDTEPSRNIGRFGAYR